MTHRNIFDPRRSLRARMALIVAILTLILALVLTGLAGQLSGDELEHNIGRNLSQLSALMVNQIDRTMFERWRESRIVASQSALFSAIDSGSIDSARTLLTEIKSSYRYYAWVGWVSPTGQVIAGSNGLLEGQDVTAQPWFIAARDTHAPFVGAIHDDPALLQQLPVTDPSDNLPRRYIDIATAIHNSDGQLLGVIGAYLDWRFVSEQTHTVEQQFLINWQDSSSNSSGLLPIDVLIVASDGSVLYGPPAFSAATLSDLPKLSLTSIADARASTQPGYLIENWPDTNVAYLTGYAADVGYREFAGLGWIVLIRQRADTALASVRQLQMLLFGIGLLFAVAISVVGWLLAVQITRPFLDVVARARMITTASNTIQDANLPDDLRADEVTILSTAIDHLLLSLNTRNTQLSALNVNLEHIVAERTKALMDSQRFNEKLINTTPNLLYIYDCSEHRNIYVSTAAHDLLGYTPIELCAPIEQLLPELTSPQDMAQLHTQREILITAPDNALTTQSLRVRHKADGWLWIELRETVFARDEAGRVSQVFGIAQDITARKQAEEKLQETAALQERQRLARELHDSVTQTLFSAAMIAQALPLLWKNENLAQTNLAELSRLTRGALAEMRTLLNELRPRALEMADLKELIEQLCDAARARTQTEFIVTLTGDALLPPAVQVAAYRVAQEAFNNIVKHARAKHADVRLTYDATQVELTIHDDGRGFQGDQAESTHFGLGIMHERAQEVGAQVEITSQLKQGTTVAFVWHTANAALTATLTPVQRVPTQAALPALSNHKDALNNDQAQ